jgi:hypothetical protein
VPVAKTVAVEVEPDLTEMTSIDPERMDGVVTPANGFPALMIKAVNAQGGVDEKPDISLAEQVLQLLAKLIQNEAAEMAVGYWDENCDIQLLTEASSLMNHFRCREAWGDEDDGMAKEVMESFVSKRKVSADERKNLASEGKALSDGSYPIANAGDLGNAAILARSGHGDVSAAKRLIAKRAKELGVANPLADDAQKETVETSAPEGAQEDVREDVVKAAVAEAMKPHEEAMKELQAELAKVKATPIPGGPVMTVPATVRATRERDENLAKAAYYKRMAEDVNESDLRAYYQKEAAAAEAAART